MLAEMVRESGRRDVLEGIFEGETSSAQTSYLDVRFGMSLALSRAGELGGPPEAL